MEQWEPDASLIKALKWKTSHFNLLLDWALAQLLYVEGISEELDAIHDPPSKQPPHPHPTPNNAIDISPK